MGLSSAMPVLLPRQMGPGPPTQAYLEESNLPKIMGLTGTFSGLALLTVALRFYVRAKMLRFVGPDDYVMLAAAMTSLATLICFCGESGLGIGRHIEAWQPWQYTSYLKWSYAHGLVNMWGLSLVKISIAFFLMRIVPARSLKGFLWSAIAFLSCFGLACTGTLLFQCSPIAAAWDMTLRSKPTTTCFSTSTYSKIGLFNSIINILTDVLFAVLPIPLIIKLQVNLRTKITLSLVLSLGFVACAAGIIKARLQIRVFDDSDSFFQDNFMLWYMLELNLGILAASLPSLKPLFAAVLDVTLSRLGMSNSAPTSGRSPAYYPGGLSHGSAGFRRHHDSNSFPGNDSQDVESHELTKSNGTTRTVIRSLSRRGEPEGLQPKLPRNGRVTSGTIDERDERGNVSAGRSESEERLHRPQGGILRRVEMFTTREDVR